MKIQDIDSNSIDKIVELKVDYKILEDKILRYQENLVVNYEKENKILKDINNLKKDRFKNN